MKVRYLVLDKKAVEIFVQSRQAQSSEFEYGAGLADFLSNPSMKPELGKNIFAIPKKDGVFIRYTNGPSNDLLVIDLEEAPLFSEQSQRDRLQIFQSLLRFSVRWWAKEKLTNSERLLPGSSKAVVFPFPISQLREWRIVIDREPDKKRAEKRVSYGSDLLVYKWSKSEGEGPHEEPSLTNYKKARTLWSEIFQLKGDSAKHADQPGHGGPIAVTALEGLSASISGHQGYSGWMDYGLLTRKQKSFVEVPLKNPHRIQGAAGTGKTLCLVLKAIHACLAAKKSNEECHLLFVVHSESTKNNVEALMATNDPEGFVGLDRMMSLQSITLTTLHQLCSELLGSTTVSEIEYLDPDGWESKQIQLLYAIDATEKALNESFKTHKRFLSDGFSSFLEITEEWVLGELIQHEVSVMIKGRAQSDLERYRKLPPLKHGLPTESDADKDFVFSIFRKYEESLRIANKFDTDDIVLSAIGQLDTPIWQRRRVGEGFDRICVDETHLFNLNELSIFHYLTRTSDSFPIAYSVDVSQAIGDWGWTEDNGIERVLQNQSGESQITTFGSIFRSSKDILNLAASVTSSGAMLFTNFDNPLLEAEEVSTIDDEGKSRVPEYFEYPSDEVLIEKAFEHASKLAVEIGCKKADIAIVPFSPELHEGFKRFISERNKPAQLIKFRGDLNVVRRAQEAGHFLIGAADVIGGLEFSGVVLVGVDRGRVPPTNAIDDPSSNHFLSYASHNRLYVAITRAKYRLEVLISSGRGLSKILDNAVANQWLVNGISE